MKKVVVTGATGKSGLFFYKELCKHADELTDYEFAFVARNREKAEALLNDNRLNQRILTGSLADGNFVGTICEGGKNAPSHCRHTAF